MTPRRFGAAVIAGMLAVGAGSSAPQAQAQGRASQVVVAVRPAVAGVPVLLHGHRYVTDAAGNVALPARPRELAAGQALLRRRIRFPSARLSPTRRVRFSRWVGRTATVVLLRPVRIDLVDPARVPVDPAVVPRVMVRGTDGSVLTLRSGKVSWLAARHAVWRPRSGWRTARISYTVKEARTHGTNVVRRSQQRFAPSKSNRVTVRVLFFAAHFTLRDALFGWPTGKAIVVRFPDGHTERHRLGANGELRLEGLPRGDYVVTGEGPGLSFSMPVALSRSQVVQLRVISWIDIAIVTTALLFLAIALAVARRPALRRLRRVHRQSAAAGGSDHG